MCELSVIVVTYNSEREIRGCLDSLHAELGDSQSEVIVVDNASKDSTCKIVRDNYSWVRLIENKINAGFPGANNQAIGIARGQVLFLLNPDTIVAPGSVWKMVAKVRDNVNVGAVGPRLVDGFGRDAPDLTLPSVGSGLRRALLGRRLGRRPTPGQVEVLSGAAMMTRRDVVERVGLLDEQMFWREDVDYSYRIARAGLVLQKVSDAVVVHLEGRSAASNIALALEKPVASQIAFFMKHRGWAPALVESGWLAVLTSLRAVKWTIVAAMRPSEEASRRRTALWTVLRKIPRYYTNALALYGEGGNGLR